jgi:hypothetical protein
MQIQINALPQGAYYLMITERNENTSAIPFLINRECEDSLETKIPDQESGIFFTAYTP